MRRLLSGSTGWSARGWLRRRRLASLEAESPLDPAQYVFLVKFVLPDVVAMSERGVKDIALAVLFGPRHRVMPRFTLLVRMFVENQKFVNTTRVIILQQVDLLLLDAVGLTQRSGRRVTGIFDQALDTRLSAMCLKFAAQHFDVGVNTLG